jgi:hypothetical protein
MRIISKTRGKVTVTYLPRNIEMIQKCPIKTSVDSVISVVENSQAHPFRHALISKNTP